MAVASAVLVSGCANQSASGSVYTYGQAQNEQIVRLGTVQSVRYVTIQSEQPSGFGGVSGAAVGGVAGSTIGGGRGNILATMGGAILGGLAGNAIENKTQKRQGIEITVQMDNGETRAIAQEADVMFTAGQRVRVLSGNGPTRVTPL
ncbi:MAG: glycine zipper 2TM domain-containing protein [Alcaligenaceae bacterium]|nr:glycine zipper 2TM domain-containing protein [Paenalcaligenes sp.]NLJ61743.1 glycine zipper 2TM domain-containing protein [Alcaligenaceae bacterium]